MHIPPDTIAVVPVRLNGHLCTRHLPQRLGVNVQTSPQASRASFRARSRHSTHRHTDTVHRGAHSQELEPPTNATLPCQPINGPARATYRATSPSTPTQSHKQEALRSKHVKPMTSPQRIHLVIATAMHGVRQPPIRKSRHARPTLSNLWDLPRVGPFRDTHNGTAPLPGSLSPLPRRRLPHLVLKAGRAAREEHRGRLRATDRAQDRCTWSPCRPPCRHSSNGKCHCRLGVCHRCSGKAPTCLVTQAHEQRSRAMLPLTMTLPNAAQRQPRRSFMTMRTDDEQMRTQTADERTVSLMQCPCHAWSHSHGRRARTTKHKQHDLDLAFHPEPCRWCLYSI